MEVTIIVIVVVAAALAGWWLLSRQDGSTTTRAVPGDDFSGERKPTSVEFDGSTAIVTFDLQIADDGPDDGLRDLLLRQAREGIRGKGVDVDRISVRAWRGGHVTEVARAAEGVPSRSDDTVAGMPEAADFDPLGALHNTDFGSGVGTPRTTGELKPIGSELDLTQGVRDLLRGKGVDVATMSMSQMTVALLEATGYTVKPRSVPGTYDAASGSGSTFIEIVDHETGAYPELDEEVVNSFVLRFLSSGADRGLLFTDKYAPFAVYDKERRDPRIRFIGRERVQAFVNSVAMR